MIKGNTRERLEYAEYVRDTAYYVENIFLDLRTKCRILNRYYSIQASKRELSAFEIAAANLASLTAYCSCHIGSLLYIWLINEGLPYTIKKMKPMKPSQIVTLAEISELFIKYPKTVLEATLLKTNISYDWASAALKAYEDKDSEALSAILAKAEISTIWPAFILLDIINEFSTLFQNPNGLNPKDAVIIIRGKIQDVIDTIEVDTEIDSEMYLFPQLSTSIYDVENLLERLDERIESEDVMVCRDLIGASIIFSRGLYETFKTSYGEYEPIVETMGTIISNEYFIGIEKMYEDIINIERIEGYWTCLGNLIPQAVESVACESEFSNEASETTLMKFLDEVLVFDGDKRIEFVNKYLTCLTNYFYKIDNAIALYSFAGLFYPEVPKGGRYTKDKVTAATRLTGGIQWKEHPSNIDLVRDGLVALNPTKLSDLTVSVQKESVSPARRMDYLVKLTSSRSHQYSWIKDFIEDYWPQVALEEFERKYKIKE